MVFKQHSQFSLIMTRKVCQGVCLQNGIITINLHTIFPQMIAPALIISTIDMPRCSNETPYLEGKQS